MKRRRVGDVGGGGGDDGFVRVRSAVGEEGAWSRSAAARSAALANWVRAVQQLRELRERAPLQRPAILRTTLGDARERAERRRRHQSGERPLGAARGRSPSWRAPPIAPRPNGTTRLPRPRRFAP